MSQIVDFLYPARNFIPWKRHALKRESIAPPPFFIIGSGRSGTTLLRRILIQNPEIHIPPETYVLGKMVVLFQRNASMRWSNLVNLMLATIEYQTDFSTFNIPNLNELALGLRGIPATERTLSNIVDQFYRYHAMKQGVNCTIWGDKTPLNTLNVESIHKLFPEAKYIYLVRNGYDVVYSYCKTGLYTSYKEAANRWRRSNEKALKFKTKNGKNIFQVKYENIVTNPSRVVPDIFSFLGVSYRKEYLTNPANIKMGDVEKKPHHYNIEGKILGNRIGMGKRKIPDEEIESIKSILMPIQKRLGYE